MARINFFPYQRKAISELKTGSILKGGVGSGKSITALGYYYIVECGGKFYEEVTPMTSPKDLYVITTPRKRDDLDWEREASYFAIANKRDSSINGVKLHVDSWNNISKYTDVDNAFFIFDEQKTTGYGPWVKSFLKIAKKNHWILLTATPGDVWIEYLAVFIANGYYKNKRDFVEQHVIYSPYTSFPKIQKYINVKKLQKLKDKVIVEMEYEKRTTNNIVNVILSYDTALFDVVYKDRWNPYKQQPIRNAAELYYTMRKVVNSSPTRFAYILELLKTHKRLIIFYSFDYELEILRKLNDVLDIPVAEYNGHIHEPLPQGDSWIYLAHYVSAGEAWECTTTNTIVLYSRNYSYKQTVQAMGRIDRQNTPYDSLNYYFLTSNSYIDDEVYKAYNEKRNFNESKNYKKLTSRQKHML